MITIYSETNSNRLSYTCQFIFENVLSSQFKITTSLEDFETVNGLKINYSEKDIHSDIQLFPNGILSESEIKEQDISAGEWQGLTTIFHTQKGTIPFDLFSATFYFISRYEEYLPHKKDKHDRYLPEESTLFKLGILETPIVDKWCYKLGKLLNLKSDKRKYRFLSTIDVDNAFAYKFKSLPIKIGGSMKSILKGNLEDLKRRFQVYFGGKSDPYDTYDFISEVHSKHEIEGAFFFLLSDRNQWDKNLPFSNRHLRLLIKSLHGKNQVGIHPGYLSYTDQVRTHVEKLRLEDALGEQVEHSRQHFLKFKFPETPRILSEVEIKQDYSLGYASQLGFRAGTCSPFQFFDLEKDKLLNLTLHSSAIMDTTLNNYLKLSPEEALLRIQNIIKEVKESEGELITIWHNETLSDIREWKGWRSIFEKMVSSAKS